MESNITPEEGKYLVNRKFEEEITLLGVRDSLVQSIKDDSSPLDLDTQLSRDRPNFNLKVLLVIIRLIDNKRKQDNYAGDDIPPIADKIIPDDVEFLSDAITTTF